MRKKAAPAGRPTFKVTQRVINKAERVAAQGLTNEQIAITLGIHRCTLNEKKKLYPELKEAIERGRTKGIEEVTNALFEKAVEGDGPAMKFYLTNRDPANWKDVQERKLSGANGDEIKIDTKWTVKVVK